MQAGATGRHRPFLKSARRSLDSKCKLDAKPGPARREIRHAHVGLRQPAAREAEAAPHLRHPRAAVPPLLREAARRKGSTGENLLQLLESRLDNVVYRMGFGSTRAEARQLVRHSAITVNGKVVNIPSALVKARRRRRVTEKAKAQLRIQDALQLAEKVGFPSWVEVDVEEDDGHVQGRAGPLRVRPGHQRKPGRRAVFEVSGARHSAETGLRFALRIPHAEQCSC